MTEPLESKIEIQCADQEEAKRRAKTLKGRLEKKDRGGILGEEDDAVGALAFVRSYCGVMISGEDDITAVKAEGDKLIVWIRTSAVRDVGEDPPEDE